MNICRRLQAGLLILSTGALAGGVTGCDLRAGNAADSNEPRARNVILFVGDGMGVTTVTAARIFAGQMRGEQGEENVLSFERFPHTALSKTYNTDAQVPDSAGTMTAMMSGEKTRAGVIGMDADIERGRCPQADRGVLPTLLEEAEDRGLATGIVTTTRITHATPAATYAHAPERNWEHDQALPADARAAGCRDIARQLVELDRGDGIEVILGGGRSAFYPDSAQDPEDADSHGARGDGRDLVAEWQARHAGSRYVWNTAQFQQLDPAATDKLLGLFERSHMQYEADRAEDAGGEPSLAAMTAWAVNRLARAETGYFLMVEGGRIDHGHHAGNAYRALTDAVAFADAVQTAAELTDADETLIVVTADHSHTLTIGGYPQRGNPILGLVTTLDGERQTDAAGRPFTTLGYANGPGVTAPSTQQPAGVKRYPHYPDHYETAPSVRPDLSEVDTTAPDYLQEATVPLMSETHGGEDVAVYARGPGADRVRGVIEQNVIYDIMRAAYGWE